MWIIHYMNMCTQIHIHTNKACACPKNCYIEDVVKKSTQPGIGSLAGSAYSPGIGKDELNDSTSFRRASTSDFTSVFVAKHSLNSFMLGPAPTHNYHKYKTLLETWRQCAWGYLNKHDPRKMQTTSTNLSARCQLYTLDLCFLICIFLR